MRIMLMRQPRDALAALNPSARKAIFRALDALPTRLDDIRRLQGHEGMYRLKLSRRRLRVLFKVDDSDDITIVAIGQKTKGGRAL